MKLSLSFLTLAAGSLAAYVPSEPWSTLTPDAAHSCAQTDYTKTFGIAIETITSQVNINAKRDVVTQIGDGQIQAPKPTSDISEIVPTASGFKPTQSDEITYETDYVTKTVTRQKTTKGKTVDVPETTTETYIFTKTVHHFNYESVKVPETNTHQGAVVTQIGDGQIQAPKPTQAGPGVNGNAQNSASARILSSKALPSATSSSAGSCATDGPVAKVSTCKSENDLSVKLAGGVLTDAKGRLGSIVSNRQFQFDGPPPQAGAIYAAGWGIVDGHLSLGEDEIFWECLSGDFYNLYDQYIAEQCVPVYLNVVDLVDC